MAKLASLKIQTEVWAPSGSAYEIWEPHVPYAALTLNQKGGPMIVPRSQYGAIQTLKAIEDRWALARDYRGNVVGKKNKPRKPKMKGRKSK